MADHQFMQFDRGAKANNTHRNLAASWAILLAIFTSPAAGWPDRLPVPSEHSPGPSPGPPIRTAAAQYECPVNSKEATEGFRLLQGGRFVEARTKLRSALGVAEAGNGAEPAERACLMNMIGMAELKQRHSEVAIEWFERGLEQTPLSDALAAVLTGNLASAYGELNRWERAEELARRAIHLSARAFGSDSEEILFPQTTLAFIHVARGEYEVAEPVLRRVLHQAERSWGSTSYEVARAAGNLAMVHFAQGRYAVARELFQKSLSGLLSNPMRAKDEIPLTQASLAVSCAAGGRSEEARLLVERALRYSAEELSTEDPNLAVVFERAAIAQFLLKDYDSARQLFDRAITLLEARYGPWSEPVHGALERYSGLLHKAKDKARARRFKALRKELDARLQAFVLKR